jgi:parallel beta-helix repeat protein
MYLINLQDSTIEYNHVYKANHVGIYVTVGGNVVARFNEVNNCTYSGIQFLNTASGRAEHNTVYYNGYSGIYVHNGCTNAMVTYNNVHDNSISLTANTAGIKVISDGTTVEYNVIENNKLDGIYVTSDNNIIQNNTISGNNGAFSGIHLTATADGNEIHFNNIFGNVGTDVYGVYKEGGSTVNATYNYWGASNGPYHPTLNPTGSGDKVSDYVDFIPWLPLMHDVAVIDVTVSPTTVVAGETVTINVTVENQGSDYENFTVTVYYDSTAIASQNVINLLPNWNTTLTFYWNTAGMARDNYTIKAEASTVPGEIDLLDNVFIDGKVEVLWHDVAIVDVIPSQAWVYQGHTVNISVTVRNEGDFSEAITVTLYYNITASKIIGTKIINLLQRENQAIVFTWDTTGVKYCHNYTITAVATIAFVDNDPVDNTLTDGKIKVRILGDLNGDGVVDGSDFYVLLVNWGKSYP